MIVQMESSGLLRVVDAPEVEWYTKQGYRLRAVLQDEVVRNVERSLPPYDPNDRHAPPRIVWEKVSTPGVRYLMELDEESALAAAHAERAAAEQRAAESEAHAAAARREADGAQAEIVKEKAEREKAERELEFCHRERESERETHRRYERDLGRLREVLGSERFAEIVGTR